MLDDRPPSPAGAAPAVPAATPPPPPPARLSTTPPVPLGAPAGAAPRSPFAPTGAGGARAAEGAWAQPTSAAGLPGYPAGPPLFDPSRPPAGGLGGSPGPPLSAEPGGRPSIEGPSTRARASTGSLLLAALIGAVVATLVTILAVGVIDGTRTPPPAVAAGGTSLDIRGLLERTQPSVVTIRTGETSGSGLVEGAGSGVIIDEDGLVLTNAHVLGGAGTVSVTLYDGATFDAELVGSFPDADVALVRILAPDEALVPAELGSADDVRVGDPVIAIGNALNLGGPPSVTEGIISAKNRTIQTPEGTLANLVQTDAAINPGNSGGPLLDASGRVVGINTAIISDAQNIGFAISIDEVKPLIDQLKSGNGDITLDTAFLGVSTMGIGDVSPTVLDEYGIDRTDGAFVNDVESGSAAEEAGLQAGDVIVEMDGTGIGSPSDVGAAVRGHAPGDRLRVVVERDGEQVELEAVLKSRRDRGR